MWAALVIKQLAQKFHIFVCLNVPVTFFSTAIYMFSCQARKNQISGAIDEVKSQMCLLTKYRMLSPLGNPECV